MEDKALLQHDLKDTLRSVQLFSNAIGVQMYHHERAVFLTELIQACDHMIDHIEPLCEKDEPSQPHRPERAALFQWRMDDLPYAME